ncbi:MAG: protein-tyrosine phosphatase [Shewanella psychromarinicola]|jgi:protein-tyrosine phosphatase|uniref:phosphatase domain-containing protein n=1 Tax=Shewanella psychromarinicola TaxID=2487742 RepID=UPI003EEF71A9
MSHPYDILTLNNGAHLIFTPCPGTKGANVVESISTLKRAGADILITLMFDEEMERNNVSSLSSVCEKQGIKWIQLPIIDDEAPNELFEPLWDAQKPNILSIIKSKRTIAVHCKGGTGRTGLVIGLILLSLGWPREIVIDTVQKIRPNALKNDVQLDYLTTFAVNNNSS